MARVNMLERIILFFVQVVFFIFCVIPLHTKSLINSFILCTYTYVLGKMQSLLTNPKKKEQRNGVSYLLWLKYPLDK